MQLANSTIDEYLTKHDNNVDDLFRSDTAGYAMDEVDEIAMDIAKRNESIEYYFSYVIRPIVDKLLAKSFKDKEKEFNRRHIQTQTV